MLLVGSQTQLKGHRQKRKQSHNTNNTLGYLALCEQVYHFLWSQMCQTVTTESL